MGTPRIGVGNCRSSTFVLYLSGWIGQPNDDGRRAGSVVRLLAIFGRFT
jgi:hypothetical protein